MADISVTAASVVASANAVILRQYNAGATVTAGQVVYLDSNYKWQLMDANASATGNSPDNTRGIALGGGANNQPLAVATRDSHFTPGATMSNGIAYYASPNAGGIAPVADLGAGNYPTFLGIAKSTTILNLNPTSAGITV
jgi:hypothetical protein